MRTKTLTATGRAEHVRSRRCSGVFGMLALITLTIFAGALYEETHVGGKRAPLALVAPVVDSLMITPIRAIGRLGSGDGEFRGPYGVHVANDELFVADDLGHT